MTADRAGILAEYRAAASEIRPLVDGLSASQLERRPGAAEWSVAEMVHHLADTEIIGGGRLRLILSRDRAQVIGFDEAQLSSVTSSPARGVQPSLALLELHMRATADLLEGLDEDAWHRSGVLENGTSYPVEGWLRRRLDHAREHAEQIRRILAT